MKVRDSGMPDEIIWSTFFNIAIILKEMEITSEINDLVEIGFGYGTFTIPCAKTIGGNVFAFDIDSDMHTITQNKLKNEQLSNVHLELKDILLNGTGLKENIIDYVMLFNILHHESPNDFFREAHRILILGGKIGIIHWRSDISTPRGPDLSIRPRPEQLIAIIDKTKFKLIKEPFILNPYHYGFIIQKI